ncbi:MAG: hypothetical protein LBR26_04580 [Prevotella sp.]|jgi:hypothetical protein|nr:hypothetical protein [Prevotella sp.]
MKAKTILIYAALLLFGAVIGFFSGRKTITEVVKTEVVKGEPVANSVTGLQPSREDVPDVPMLPIKTDTIYADSVRYIVQSVDTAAIIREYELKRHYAATLFDNQYGKLDISLNTQYNRLGELTYNFEPLYTVKTVERKRVWVPFVSASYSTLNKVGVGGGIFYNDIGLQIEYVTDFEVKGLNIGLLYKF